MLPALREIAPPVWRALKNRLTVDEPSDADYLLARHLRPMPRVLHGARRCVTWRHRLSIFPTA